MKLYKLTDKDLQTRSNFQWQLNKKEVKPKIKNPQLCSSDVFHAYKDLNLAFLLNPIHANFTEPKIFECSGRVVCQDFGKVGVFNLTLKKEIQPPEWVGSEYEQKVRLYFALLSAKAVLKYYEKEYPNDKRVREVIKACEDCIKNPSEETAEAAWAAWVSWSSEEVAWAAARAAEAAWAAWAAAKAARAADKRKINFSLIAKEATKLAKNEEPK